MPFIFVHPLVSLFQILQTRLHHLMSFLVFLLVLQKYFLSCLTRSLLAYKDRKFQSQYNNTYLSVISVLSCRYADSTITLLALHQFCYGVSYCFRLIRMKGPLILWIQCNHTVKKYVRTARECLASEAVTAIVIGSLKEQFWHTE